MGENAKEFSVWKMITLCCGNAGILMFTGIAGSFISYYFTDIVGIDATSAGTVVTVASLIATCINFFLGHLMDNSKPNKLGKSRPWAIGLCIPSAISVVVLYGLPSNVPTSSKIIVSIVAYLLYCVLTTVLQSAYQAMTTNITQGAKTRSSVSMINMFVSNIQGIILSGTLLVLVDKFGSGKKGFLLVSILFVVIGVVLQAVCYSANKEQIIDYAGAKSKEGDKQSLGEGIKLLAKNKYWIMITLEGVFFNAWFSFFMGSQAYFAIYVLGDPSKIGLLFSAATIPGMVAMLIMTPVVAKFGRRRTILASGIFVVLGIVIMILAGPNFSLFMVGMCIRGFFAGPLMGSEFAMLMDTVDYGEYKTGVRQSGFAMTTNQMLKKIVGSVLSGATGWIMGAFGYVANAEQTASGIMGIKMCYLYIPLFCVILAYACIYFYKLDSEYDDIVKELKERHR